MDTSSANRLQMWRAALERAKQRPVLGIGTANFAYISDQELRMHSRYGGGLRVHNAFLELLAENGIPGLLLYLLAILITLNYLRKSKKLSKRIGAHDGAMLALCLQIAIIVFLFRGLTGSNQGDDVFYYFLGASIGLYRYLKQVSENPEAELELAAIRPASDVRVNPVAEARPLPWSRS